MKITSVSYFYAGQCPPYAKIDAVVILDSSSSITRPNWNTLVAFVQRVIRDITLGAESARIGVFRYNRRVDTVNQILMSDFPNDKAGLQEAIANIPYNGFGKKTFTQILTLKMFLCDNHAHFSRYIHRTGIDTCK
ncbi:collagen alpha-1(XII) chain-like [Ciona intestinalis]